VYSLRTVGESGDPPEEQNLAPQQLRGVGLVVNTQSVPSLLDAMAEGREYGSIVSLVPDNMDITSELRRALTEIEKVRGRPCICYAANIIKDNPHSGIEAADHLPFNEMVAAVPPPEVSKPRAVDVFLVTPGGSPYQVNLFVEALRQKFDDVNFIIPYKAMSAGTLWALSGDAIWMDSRAFLGPIDPQLPASDGRYGPAQALLVLLAHIQQEGAARLAKNQDPDWTHVLLLQNMDKQKLGQALSSSQYMIDLAAQYLERYKFRTWINHSDGRPVTQEDREERAQTAAVKLCKHDYWKAHGHAIGREVLFDELRIKADRLEDIPGLERAVRRAWALWYYVFDKIPVAKTILSQQYSYFRFGKEP